MLRVQNVLQFRVRVAVSIALLTAAMAVLSSAPAGAEGPNPNGSGCASEGGQTLPDGRYFGFMSPQSHTTFRFDLACIYLGKNKVKNFVDLQRTVNPYEHIENRYDNTIPFKFRTVANARLFTVENTIRVTKRQLRGRVQAVKTKHADLPVWLTVRNGVAVRVRHHVIRSDGLRPTNSRVKERRAEAVGSGCMPDGFDTLPDGLWLALVKKATESSWKVDVFCRFFGIEAFRAAWEQGVDWPGISLDFRVNPSRKRSSIRWSRASSIEIHLPPNARGIYDPDQPKATSRFGQDSSHGVGTEYCIAKSNGEPLEIEQHIPFNTGPYPFFGGVCEQVFSG